MPDKYLIKSMRGANMTLQNIRGNNAKRFGFKSEIYLNLKKIDFYEVWIFAFGKMFK